MKNEESEKPRSQMMLSRAGHLGLLLFAVFLLTSCVSDLKQIAASMRKIEKIAPTLKNERIGVVWLEPSMTGQCYNKQLAERLVSDLKSRGYADIVVISNCDCPRYERVMDPGALLKVWDKSVFTCARNLGRDFLILITPGERIGYAEIKSTPHYSTFQQYRVFKIQVRIFNVQTKRWLVDQAVRPGNYTDADGIGVFEKTYSALLSKF